MTNEDHLSPVFVAISSYNRVMGDYFINNFLKLDKQEQHTRLVTELIISSKDFLYERMKILHRFIIDQVTEIKNAGVTNQSDIAKKITAFSPFIDTYCTCLMISAADLRLYQD